MAIVSFTFSRKSVYQMILSCFNLGCEIYAVLLPGEMYVYPKKFSPLDEISPQSEFHHGYV